MRLFPTFILLLLATLAPAWAATPIGPDTVLPINHTYLDQAGNPEVLSVYRLRLVDGSNVVLSTDEVAATPSPGPTNAPLATLLGYGVSNGDVVTLEVQAVDLAGNEGNWVTFGLVQVDLTPPADPTFGTPFDGTP